jgi:hypothetical protein
MLLAARMRRLAPDRASARAVRMTAWLASELLVRKGKVSYETPEYNPEIPYENNEVIRYMNLALRADLGTDEVLFRDRPTDIRAELTFGLNRCYQFGKGAGSPLQRRAWRMGETVSRLATRYLPEGSIELINAVAS